MDAEDADAETEDLSYETCYVFRPADASEDEIDNRPRKKRKTAPSHEESNPPRWPTLAGGAEPQSLADWRQQTFQQAWSSKEQELRAIADEVDETTLEGIEQYLEQAQTTDGKLPTAIVIADSDGRQLSRVLSRRQELHPEDIHLELQANQATNLQTALKSVIRNAVESHAGRNTYTAHLAHYKRSIPMHFDLELLQKYMAKKDLGRVVVSIPDAETFDLGVLSELLSNLTSWSDRISFVVILSLATTVQLFESRMSKSAMRQLDSKVFVLTSAKHKLFDLFCAAALRSGNDSDSENSASVLHFGPSITASLYDLTEDQSTTVTSFIQAIKYCYMTHFFANPLSVLLGEGFQTQDTTFLGEAIRSTPSFQTHCNLILDGKVTGSDAKTVRQMLEFDEKLLQYVSDNLAKSRKALQTIEHTLQLLALIAHHLDPTTTPFKHYADLKTSFHRNTLPNNDTYNLILTTLPTLSPNSLTTLQTVLTPHLTHLSLPTPITSQSLRTHLLSLPHPTTLAFTESLTLTTPYPLRTTFHPRPRHATTRALSLPADYLACECCTATNSSRSGIEPTATLYALLDEAGREVNVMDLWSAFLNIVQPSAQNGEAAIPNTATEGKTNAKGKAKTDRGPSKNFTQKRGAATTNGVTNNDQGGHAEKHDGDEERKHVTSFYRALAELKYLGLVKQTSDRRLGRGKGKGVEVVSRVVWHGL